GNRANAPEEVRGRAGGLPCVRQSTTGSPSRWNTSRLGRWCALHHLDIWSLVVGRLLRSPSARTKARVGSSKSFDSRESTMRLAEWHRERQREFSSCKAPWTCLCFGPSSSVRSTDTQSPFTFSARQRISSVSTMDRFTPHFTGSRREGGTQRAGNRCLIETARLNTTD